MISAGAEGVAKSGGGGQRDEGLLSKRSDLDLYVGVHDVMDDVEVCTV